MPGTVHTLSSAERSHSHRGQKCSQVLLMIKIAGKRRRLVLPEGTAVHKSAVSIVSKDNKLETSTSAISLSNKQILVPIIHWETCTRSKTLWGCTHCALVDVLHYLRNWFDCTKSVREGVNKTCFWGHVQKPRTYPTPHILRKFEEKVGVFGLVSTLRFGVVKNHRLWVLKVGGRVSVILTSSLTYEQLSHIVYLVRTVHYLVQSS